MFPINSLNKTNLMLDLISTRQEALSNNLANIDTPGYVRKDIEFSQYMNIANSPLETELSRKMGPSGVMLENQTKLTPEEELAEMQKNSLLYSMAARKMSTMITEIKTVANVGK